MDERRQNPPRYSSAMRLIGWAVVVLLPLLLLGGLLWLGSLTF